MTRANEAVLKKAAKWDALGNPEDRWKLEKARGARRRDTKGESVTSKKKINLHLLVQVDKPEGRVSLGDMVKLDVNIAHRHWKKVLY